MKMHIKPQGKVIWHVTVSLDGFIANSNDEMNWAFKYFSGSNQLTDEVIRSTGAILAGRRWYELATQRYSGSAGIYGGKWSGPVFVLTHRAQDIPQDPAVTFLAKGIEDAVKVALMAANGYNVVLFGSSIPQQCIAVNLLDEIVMHLVPVLLGNGIRFYDSHNLKPVTLIQNYIQQKDDLVHLHLKIEP